MQNNRQKIYTTVLKIFIVHKGLDRLFQCQGGTNKTQTKACRSHLNPQGKYEQRIDYIFLRHLGVNLFFPSLPETIVFIGMFYWKSAASHNVSCTTVLAKLHLEMTSAQL